MTKEVDILEQDLAKDEWICEGCLKIIKIKDIRSCNKCKDGPCKELILCPDCVPPKWCKYGEKNVRI